jgi:hypothetical protein
MQTAKVLKIIAASIVAAASGCFLLVAWYAHWIVRHSILRAELTASSLLFISLAAVAGLAAVAYLLKLNFRR